MSFIFETAKIVFIALLIVVPIRAFIFQPFFVRGQSMEPNFHDGDYLIVDELTYRFRPPARGEVIVFKYPKMPSQKYIKRIIALPGETVEITGGKVSIFNAAGAEVLNESAYLSVELFTPQDTRISLDQNEYFVLGDNRSASSDSRRWGALPQDDIVGRVLLRAWPPTTLAGYFEAPSYEL